MRTYMLWDNGSGTAALWRLDSSGPESSGRAVQRQFGPFAGWTARALAVGPDGRVSILWTGRDRQASVWRVDVDGGQAGHREFGPYAGWEAIGLAIGRDNVPRLLWAGAGGAAALWSLREDAAPDSLDCGPFTGWSPAALAVGPDNRAHLLWHSKAGGASLWCVDADGLADQTEFGPQGAWRVVAIAAGLGGVRLLWERVGGYAALWEILRSDLLFGESDVVTTVHGPFAGWTPAALALGGGDAAQFLWRGADRGLASVWRADGAGDFTRTEYGPYAGWTVVALAAGP